MSGAVSDPDAPPMADEAWLRDLLASGEDGPAPVLDDLATRRWVDAVLERAEAAPDDEEDDAETEAEDAPVRRRGAVWIGAAVAVAMVAALLLVVRGGLLGEPTSAPSDVARSDTAPRSEPMTRVHVPPGEPLTMELSPDVQLELGGGSVASVQSQASEGLAVQLDEGWVRAEVVPGSQRIPFRVSTRHGEVEVLGTIFEVETTSETTDVRVRRGRVRVTERSGETHFVEAGQGISLGARVRRLADEVPAAVEPETDPVPAPTTAEPEPTPSARTAAAALDAGQLMARAARARAAKRWRAAADDLSRVRRRFPDDPSACPARLAEAEIRLDHLHQGAKALSLFDAYLARCGSALRPEARYGRARALRRMGKQGRERAALLEFTKAHPSSVHMAAARLRLADLHRADGQCARAMPIYRKLIAQRPGSRIMDAAKAGLGACEGSGAPSN
ncbi:MAG: FecR domain-containing protein [Myxococcota bacterium]